MATAIVKTDKGTVVLSMAYAHMGNMFGVNIRTKEREIISETDIVKVEWIHA